MPTAIPKNLDTLSFKQLTALETQIHNLKNQKHDAAVREVQAAEAKAMTAMSQKLAQMAAERGLKPETVPQFTSQNGQHKGRKGVKAKAKIAPKYRNPDKPEETWTGRGRQPRWMTASGKQPEAFRIGA